MALNIAVCIKVSPDPEKYDQIRLNPETNTLIREGVDSVISGTDLHAVELALRVKEKFGGHITLFSMGPDSAMEHLREALGYGCDEAVLLSDRKFGRADSLATSYTLAEGIRSQNTSYDLILLGNASDDGATAHVPSQLGEWLSLPHITDISAFEMKDEKHAEVSKEVGNGINTYEVTLPAVIGVTKRVDKVRHPSIMNILQAKNKPLRKVTAADIPGLDESRIGAAGSPTLAVGFVDADYGREGRTLTGSAEDIAEAILAVVRKAEKGQG